MPELPPNPERPSSHGVHLPEFMPGSGRVGHDLALRPLPDVLPTAAAESIDVEPTGPSFVEADVVSRTVFSPEPVVSVNLHLIS